MSSQSNATSPSSASSFHCWCGEPLRLEYGERFIDVNVSGNQHLRAGQLRRAYAWWRCPSGHLSKPKDITPPLRG